MTKIKNPTMVIDNTRPNFKTVITTKPDMKNGYIVETERYYTQILTKGMYILPWLTQTETETVESPVSF